MFDKLGVKILGLVDNMSYFVGDDNKKYNIFGNGGVKNTAEEFNKEFLGEIPINPEVGKSGDKGKPIVEKDPDNEISKILKVRYAKGEITKQEYEEMKDELLHNNEKMVNDEEQTTIVEKTGEPDPQLVLEQPELLEEIEANLCVHCGKELEDSPNFCPYCGNTLGNR